MVRLGRQLGDRKTSLLRQRQVNKKEDASKQLQHLVGFGGADFPGERCESLIQNELNGAVRNEKVYQEILQQTVTEGSELSLGQCRAKLKKLKGQ